MMFNLYKLFEASIADSWFSFLRVLDDPKFRAVAAVILSFLFVVLLGKRTIRWLIKQKIGDAPEFYNADLNKMTRHKASTPTMGGILISGAILVCTLLLADLGNFYIRVGIICLICFTALGSIDDWLKLTSARRGPGGREGLKSWEKLVFQVGFALLFGFFIHHHGVHFLNQPEQTTMLSLPFQRTYVPGTDILNPELIKLPMWAFGIVTVIVIAGSSNAANLTDGMDGLASGIMAIVSIAFVVLCLITGSDEWAPKLLVPYIDTADELAVIAGAMLGSCLGFLWWNCHPAHVFMGDTGSLPLGALIGYIAVVIRQELLLFVVGGVLVAEVMSVVLQVGYFKATRGSRLFRMSPIHHHFHLAGWTEQQVVVRFWLIGALLAAIGLATLKLR